MNVFAILNGDETLSNGALSNGAICSLIAILLVFVILFIIIGITTLVFKIIDIFEVRKPQAQVQEQANNQVAFEDKYHGLDVNDETVMAAILVASIDYQNEIKKNVKLVSIKEVK